ncbi:hypothetical protein F4604DRAFT_2028540 [Suillus subluteus]|nr:hypothetical protein F4604DRAFT_2028540 [Suillus subluteus]
MAHRSNKSTMGNRSQTATGTSEQIANVCKLYQGRQVYLSFEVIIVGCGLGGVVAAYCLTQAAHKVTILEATLAIGEIGAGIQVGPTLTQLLIRWGLGKRLEEVTVKPDFRRCESFHLCLYIPLIPLAMFWATVSLALCTALRFFPHFTPTNPSAMIVQSLLKFFLV